ncbi:pyrimidine (deoxy)nucleoside triphosphate pyrophosphohydrolase [Halolamina pelagica]|uniref:Pyrimidine (Deoxy)nucleoside triphosphate pyrophosphohydrolase n=1 Tax=Halolamina pelagica TaxID=699431 RepID=A0A0P7GXW0_9EURY|nr:NUDIX domain-containing protein [Halolamina pelagica]KPN30314.1 pyrimidine (deoxy)nucleoside triphosphate pyrophosphohydrolase [Halolamina pelagica]
MSRQFAVTQKAVLFGPERRLLLLENEAGVWELPGGQLHTGEQPVPGLQRAIRETTGLDASVDGPILNSAWEIDEGGAFAAVYRARSPTEQATLAGDHVRAVWLAPDEALERDLNSTQKRAIELAGDS